MTFRLALKFELDDGWPSPPAPGDSNAPPLAALKYFADRMVKKQDVATAATSLDPRTLSESDFSAPRLIAAIAEEDT